MPSSRSRCRWSPVKGHPGRSGSRTCRGVFPECEETEQKTKNRETRQRYAGPVREDIGSCWKEAIGCVLLKRLCRGFTTVQLSFLLVLKVSASHGYVGSNLSGVIHSVPAKNKKKTENRQRNSVSSWSRTKAVLCKDANSWFWVMLIVFCLPPFVFGIGYVSRPSRHFRKVPASNV